MPIEIVEPRRLYRQVADQLRSLIDGGEFPVGSRLPTERELAVQLGISRPTVREALIALEVDGRVRIRVGSGIYVLPPPDVPVAAPLAVAGPFEVLEARALFEGAVAEDAARRARPADIAAIDAALTAMREGEHPGTETMMLDREFHTTVARILGNDAVTAVVGDLFDQRMNPYFAHLARYFENATTWRDAHDEHVAIRDRIAAGDAAGARLAMQAHLKKSQERFSKNFTAVDPLKPPRLPHARSTPSGRRAAAI